MPERYLLVQLADRGDLILTTPALAALREAHPTAHLTLLTSSHSAPLVENTGLVDAVLTFDRDSFNSSKALLRPANLRRILKLRRGGYDTVIFFHHFTLRLGTLKFALIALASGAKRRVGLDNGRGWFLTHRLPDAGFGAKHQAQYWLDLVGLVDADSSPRPAVVVTANPLISPTSPLPNELAPDVGEGFRPSPTAESEDKTGTPTSPKIIIHAGSGGYSTARRWSPESFAAVGDALHAAYNAQIILVGGAGDDGAAVKAAMGSEPLDLIGKTESLAELAGVIQSADLFIGGDSGVSHLAAAVGTPVVAVFGPSNPAAWSPWNPAGTVSIVRSAPECSPCNYVGHGIGLRDGCPARTCMRMVTPEQVITAARAILNSTEIKPGVGAGLRRSSTENTSETRDTHHHHILTLPVDAITYAEWLDTIGVWVRDKERLHHVCTINPEFTMIARKDPNFDHILRRADLCVPDGVGLLLAARYLGFRLPERVTGSDGVPIIAARAAQEGWKLFFLGAAPGVAEQAAAILREQHPALQIAGTYSGSPAPEEEDSLVEMVNASGADILFVAYGAPEQDKWIARNTPRLKVSMAMGVGGAFDFIAGVVPRAPLWMRRAGLEWLFRLYRQPWRFWRMLRLPLFALAVVFSRPQNRQAL
ncbi:MAG: WecB/TagA/CpsF family glycosyltransferase [Anaerolineaceae bacterium]|nr:WecB/TagA/CpsF family glycosyltransferase [Anaerolineaceae bacterium]